MTIRGPVRITAAGCVAILLLDTLASVASEALDFRYGLLWPLSTLVYASTAYAAARSDGRVRTGVLAGLAVAATDATLGWAVSWLIGPGRPAAAEDREALLVIATSLTVMAGGALVGLLAGLASARVRRRAGPARAVSRPRQ